MDTSWQKVSRWYDASVGEGGHYYHREVVLPNLLRLMDLQKEDKVLDIACGQGILARSIDEDISYIGVDGSADFIRIAKEKSKSNQVFLHADVTKPFLIDVFDFTKVAIILALQNIAKPEETLRLAAKHLKKNGKIFLILNHPCFRVIKNSSWGWETKLKIQYRRIDSYLTAFRAPVVTNPGKEQSEKTWTFHWSLQDIFKMLKRAGFVVENLEEWVSPKKSEGGRARAEDRARGEFPLFMCLVATKA